ncbi:unnamed protein product, partial [Coccothraustes coccothraustes]
PRGQHRSAFPHRARSVCRGWDEAPGSCLPCGWRRRGRPGSRMPTAGGARPGLRAVCSDGACLRQSFRTGAQVASP